MRRLLIADVHANLPAFEAVLRDAGPVDEVVFLGDIVGFGPHPAECKLMPSLLPPALEHDGVRIRGEVDRPRRRGDWQRRMPCVPWR